MERREELYVQVIWLPSTNRTVDRRKETSVSQQIQQDRSDSTEWIEEERRCFHLQRKETAVLGRWGKRENRCPRNFMTIFGIGSQWSVTDRLRVDRRLDQLFNRRRISKRSNLLATQLSNHRQRNPSISCYLLACTSDGTQPWIASTIDCSRTLVERRQENVEECRLVIYLLVSISETSYRFLPGNVIDPLNLQAKLQCDGVRYCLLREDILSQDANFNEYKMKKYLNAELANTLGNLLNRVTSLSINPSRIYPARPSSSFPASAMELMEQCRKLPSQVTAAYDAFEFYHGIIAIMDVLRACNAFVQHEQPWVLAKSTRDIDRDRLQQLIFVTLECLRLSGILLQPIIPSIAKQLLDILAVDSNERRLTDCSLRVGSDASSLHLNKTDRVSLYQRLPIDDADV